MTASLAATSALSSPGAEPLAARASRGLRVAFAGGGTGGHVVPGLHLLASARGHGIAVADVLWFGSGRAIEERVFAGAAPLLERAPCERVALDLERRGGGAPSRARLALRTPAAVLAARRRLRAHASDVLVGLGGFTALPAVLAARALSIPVVLLEVNASSGAATRWLGALAERTLHAFAGSLPAGAAHAGHAQRHVHTGPPLDPAVAAGRPAREARRAARAELGFDPARPLLVVLGGSQGASPLNAFVREHAGRLLASGTQVLHQTGPGRLAEAAPALSGYRAVEYLDPVRTALAGATCALCRGGAATLAEVAALRVPAIVVPYPRAAGDHQGRNARELGEGVRVVAQPELGRGAADEVARLCGPEGRAARRAMRAVLARAVRPDGTQRIWAEIAAVVETRGWERGRG